MHIKHKIYELASDRVRDSMDDLFSQVKQVYGNANAQFARYSQAQVYFNNIYGEGELYFFRAPGRVNLIGEHTDYNHGYVMPVAIDKDVLLLVRPRTDGIIQLHNIDTTFPPASFKITKSIKADNKNTWTNYARGVAQVLANISQTTKTKLIGFNALVVSQLPYGVPTGAGLSSSSALTVVLLKALTHINNLELSIAKLAALASDAEWYLGTRGGIMDQYISLGGKQNAALFLDCRPTISGEYYTEAVSLDKNYRLLIVDSRIKHQNVGGGYNYRVAACRAGVGLLKQKFPDITHLRDIEDNEWDSFSELLPDECLVEELQAQGIDFSNIPTINATTRLKVKSRCKHVWSENKRVLQAVKAMKNSDMKLLGQLMNQAHESARDNYEISCPEIELLVDILNKQDGVLGSRLTGAGWGGCVVALVEKDSVDNVSTSVFYTYKKLTQLKPSIFPCQASDGASLVWKS